MGVISNGTTLLDAGALDSGIATGDMTLISTSTASSSATIDITSGIDSTYKEYVFKFINIHPANDDVSFQFQADVGTGTSYAQTITSSHFRATHGEDASSEGVSYISGGDLNQETGFQLLAGSVGNDADQNIAGILHRRVGDLLSAKNIYQTALSNNEISINLISNYQLLAKKLGDKELVKELTSQLVNKEKDPYELLVIAKNDLQAGHAHQAKAHLEQAITKAPYIAELYLELAKVRYQQGNIKQTQTLLEKAIELERDNQKIDVYQAKLLSLQMDK